MTHILLPENTPQQRLIFYLAMEEFLAEHLKTLIPNTSDGAFFFWQSRPTVIIGKNQDLESEVNLPWCKEHGVEIYRRKSGGGCVFSDEGNLMISCVVREHNSQKAFDQYLHRLVEILSTMGLQAVSTTHNDVLIGERKVSGNACFVTPNGTILHGTLLWKSDMEHLTAAITPSEAKLAKHAVQSVRQRVANLYDLGITDLDILKQNLLSGFLEPNGTTLRLSEADIVRIAQIEETYCL